MLFDGTRTWRDPTAVSLNRLPIRPAMTPCPDVATARRGDPTASPWWRSLDGTWDFELLDRPGALTPGHLTELGTGEQIEVPGAWTTQGHGAPQYTNVAMPFAGEPPEVPEDNPTGVYRRRIEIPAEWRDRRTVIRVGAAESMVFVYLDGAAVGYGTDSRLPSEFDLTGHVKSGGTHTLALVVLKWSASTWIEDQDQWWHGGIQRSVSMHSTAAAHISETKLVPGLDPIPRPGGTGTGTLDIALAIVGPPRTGSGWTVEVRVDGPRRATLATTGRMVVPHWNADGMLEQMAGAMFTEPGVVRGRLELRDVQPWSAEYPTLYPVFMILRDPDGAVVEVNSLRTGFRAVEVRDRQLLINGAPVILRGVNIHEHDPQRGRAVGREQTERDLAMIKSANLNAVRAAHYPHDEHFAELCDELGLYVIDEADVESHGRQWSICHDPRFGPAIVERVRRMAQRDVHHPSVIVWSLGNESGYGPPHDEAAAFLRRWDPSRPLHYEGPFMFDLGAEAPVSDIVCPMYTSVSEVVEWAERAEDPCRPLILCEYSHAMGNACGSLMDYDEAFETHEGLQGGFIWEWVEHGIPVDGMTGPDGAPGWGYGGDFGDDSREGNFVLDGLVAADREPHPVLQDIRFLGRPVRCSLVDVGTRSVKVALDNRRWFTDTSDLQGEWELTADGEVVAHGDLPAQPIRARGRRTATLSWSAGAPVPGAEHLITLRWRQSERTRWAPKGMVVAWDQFPAAVHTRPTGELPRRSPSGPGLPPSFLESWTPALFRALTDNDGISQGWMRGLNGSLERWVDQLGLDRCTWDAVAGELKAPSVAAPLKVSFTTEVLDGGWHRLQFCFDLPGELDDPPRLGVVWELPSELERLDWYGDGPLDCYPDRRVGALAGRWRSTVSEQYVGYGMPQEHGHHTAMRWVALRGPDAGLLVVGDGTQGFSARHHSDDELWRAAHTWDLIDLAAARSTFLALDVAQRGLGQSSLGEEAGERFRIRAGRHRMELMVRGLGPRENPATLYSTRPR